MEAQINWITANRVAENIVYVGHLGDLKDVGAWVNAILAWPSLASPSTEWQIVRNAFNSLDTAGILYGVTPGNDDFDQRIGTFPADRGGCPSFSTERPLVGYNTQFPPSSFAVTGYGNRIAGSNEDNYVTISTNGLNFLFINLGYQEDAPAAGSTASINWAETLVGTTFPNHITILTSHFLLDCSASTAPASGANGSCAATPNYNLSGYGSNIVTRLRAYRNFIMMVGGHRFGESYVSVNRTAEGFNSIHMVLANYQHLKYSATNFDTVPIPGPAGGSSGFFKLLEFDMGTMTVDLVSLSPALAANAGIPGNGSTILPVLSNAGRPTVVRCTRNINPTVPANLFAGPKPTLHTQSVTNLVDISFAGYATVGASIAFDIFEFALTDGGPCTTPVGSISLPGASGTQTNGSGQLTTFSMTADTNPGCFSGRAPLPCSQATQRWNLISTGLMGTSPSGGSCSVTPSGPACISSIAIRFAEQFVPDQGSRV